MYKCLGSAPGVRTQTGALRSPRDGIRNEPIALRDARLGVRVGFVTRNTQTDAGHELERSGRDGQGGRHELGLFHELEGQAPGRATRVDSTRWVGGIVRELEARDFGKILNPVPARMAIQHMDPSQGSFLRVSNTGLAERLRDAIRHWPLGG